MNININKFIENNTHIDKDEKAIVKFGSSTISYIVHHTPETAIFLFIITLHVLTK